MKRRVWVILCCVACAAMGPGASPRARAAEPLLPKHLTPGAVKSIDRGLAFLVKSQGNDGGWTGTQDGATYPVAMTSLAGMALLANGNTPTRGPYAENVRKAIGFLLNQTQPSGLIAGGAGESGMPMHGHGFALLFLSSAYGMETDARTRDRMRKAIEGAIKLTSMSQSNLGGWTYTPGGGDEGSVTITQMQGLRAAHDAGFTVPEATVENAIKYLEICKTPEGGICYSAQSRTGTRLAISAAAICCLYSAGEYDSPLAETCLKYVFGRFKASKDNFQLDGHAYYTHLYAAQAFYQAGDEYWDLYFPNAREQMLKLQQPDGAWQGDGIGPVFGTSIAVIVLQLPYKFLPIYQR